MPAAVKAVRLNFTKLLPIVFSGCRSESLSPPCHPQTAYLATVLLNLCLDSDKCNHAAAKALRLNFTELLLKVMPLWEKAAFAANYASRQLLRRHSVKPYRPDLQKCAEHICIHTGTRCPSPGCSCVCLERLTKVFKALLKAEQECAEQICVHTGVQRDAGGLQGAA
jgi:hypothetical protein